MMTEVDVESLRNQLFVARSEIKKLRQQIKNFTYVQRKEIEKINQLLKNFQCEKCRQDENSAKEDHLNLTSAGSKDSLSFLPIGVIRTQFLEKRAVPRQSVIGNKLKGRIELDSHVFTNPEHSIQELNGFSHLWIIYYFHKNKSHLKAKISPPRLCGKRVGVFSTRSPHRPCPIGLSLVKIHSIEKSTIQFYGTDMVDGTPVLDIKPYIPDYDSPTVLTKSERLSPDYDSDDFYKSNRESNDKEDEVGAVTSAIASSVIKESNIKDISEVHSNYKTQDIKIPNWITSKNVFEVVFSKEVNIQLDKLNVDKTSIVHILRADPRSVYLRTKYSCQKFTFEFDAIIITCEFDDKNSLVNVINITCIKDV